MWIWVARWLKRSDVDDVRQAAARIRKHWEDVCLDVGYDPEKNVTVAENEQEIRVGISEAVDASFREEPGAWRYS